MPADLRAHWATVEDCKRAFRGARLADEAGWWRLVEREGRA